MTGKYDKHALEGVFEVLLEQNGFALGEIESAVHLRNDDDWEDDPDLLAAMNAVERALDIMFSKFDLENLL